MPTKYDWDDKEFFDAFETGQDFFAVAQPVPAGEIEAKPDLSPEPAGVDDQPYQWPPEAWDDEDFFVDLDAKGEPQETGFFSEIVPALKTTVQRTKEMMGSFSQMIGEQAESYLQTEVRPELEAFLKTVKEEDRIPVWKPMAGALSPKIVIERGKALQQEAQKEMDRIPQSPDFVRNGDWWENLLNPETRAAQLTWMLGSNIGPTIAIASAAIMTSGAGAGSALAAGGVGAYSIESGSSYKELRAMGVDPEEARGTASIVGAINAALEVAPLGYLATKVPSIRKLIGLEVAKELAAKPVLRRTAVGLVKQGAFEGATEALQEVVQNAGKKVYDENQDLLQGTGEAAFIGAILGGTLGAGGAMLPQPSQGSPGAPTDPVTGRPSIFNEEALEANEQAKEQAVQAGVSPGKLEQVEEQARSERQQEEMAQWLDSETPAPGSVQERSATLKKEAELQVSALEEELSGGLAPGQPALPTRELLDAQQAALPTYDVQGMATQPNIEFPAIPGPFPTIEEALPTEGIVFEEVRPDDEIRIGPAKPLKRSEAYIAEDLGPVEEITAQPLDEIGVTDGSETAVTESGAIPENDGFEEHLAMLDKAPDPVAAAPKTEDVVTGIDIEAVEAKPDEASEAQLEAGNYKKGKVNMGGLQFSIENQAGSLRRPEWPVLTGHYGYVKGTEGKGGDQVDVFIKPGTDQELIGDTRVFVVDQAKSNGTGFDEHKVMIGYGSVDEAKSGYLSNYSKGWKGLGAITESSFSDFKTWLDSGNTKQPFAGKAPTTSEPVDMAKILAASGPIKAYAKAKGFKWPMGPNSANYKRLKKEFEADKSQYEQDQAGEKPAQAQAAEQDQPAPAQKASSLTIGTDWRDGDAASKLSTAEIGEQILNNRIVFGPWRAEIKTSGIGGRFQAFIDGPFTAFVETPNTVNTEPFIVFARDRLAPRIKELLSETNPVTKPQPKKPSKATARATPTAPESKKSKPLKLIMMPEETVEIEETGETATITESADAAISRIDTKLKKLRQLRDCLRS